MGKRLSAMSLTNCIREYTGILFTSILNNWVWWCTPVYWTIDIWVWWCTLLYIQLHVSSTIIIITALLLSHAVHTSLYIYTGIVDVNQSIMIACVSFAQYNIIIMWTIILYAIYIIINIWFSVRNFIGSHAMHDYYKSVCMHAWKVSTMAQSEVL